MVNRPSHFYLHGFDLFSHSRGIWTRNAGEATSSKEAAARSPEPGEGPAFAGVWVVPSLPPPGSALLLRLGQAIFFPTAISVGHALIHTRQI
ncbi:hypothetical protein NL676_021452 [Syzygium grande]|nr:hypothetical protein NL676_021452 [Syzygium grande]